VKRLTAPLYDQSKSANSKHFCERCLHGYSRKDLLGIHKPECKELLKSPTRTELPKEGGNKMSFTNYHEEMKAPYVVYADFECVLEKVAGCEPPQDESFTVNTEKHEPCGFLYIAVRSDGKLYDPLNHRGRDAVYVFLVWLQNHEREMREDMAHKRPLVMTPEDWQKHRKATDCHICNMGLVKDLYRDAMAVYDYDLGKYCAKATEDATIRRQEINMSCSSKGRGSRIPFLLFELVSLIRAAPLCFAPRLEHTSTDTKKQYSRPSSLLIVTLQNKTKLNKSYHLCIPCMSHDTQTDSSRAHSGHQQWGPLLSTFRMRL